MIAGAILRGALSALEAGRPDEFALLQRRSVDILPTALDAAHYRRQLGWSCRRLGQVQQTAVQWQRSLRADPGNARLWLELGLLAAGELDDPERAAACFRHVLDLDPDHPKARLLRAFLEARI